MPKFNIHKIIKDRESELIRKLNSVGLVLSGERQEGDFKLSFYMSEKPDGIDIWWVKLYKDYINQEEFPKNITYSAVFLLSNQHLCYAVAMGKTHFYLKEFCDMDYGINLAERIIDDKLKMKSSRLFGGKRNKAIVCYHENANVEYECGESFQYVKAKTVNKEKWGEVASFGNSVQLHLDIEPDKLIERIKDIETELANPPKILLPRGRIITDKALIVQLDSKLVKALLNAGEENSKLQADEAAVCGVDFVFIDKCQFRLLHNRHGYDIEGNLSLFHLLDFVKKNDIDLEKSLNDLKIKVTTESNRGYSKPLKYFLDFMDDERHFLFGGKWYEFSQDYIDYLRNQIDSKIKYEESETRLSMSAYSRWKESQSDQPVSLVYPEYYFNLQREGEGYRNLDRNVEQLRQYKIEKMDLYRDGTAFFVKIGTPQKLSYAIDQSINTVKLVRNNVSKLRIGDGEIAIRKMCLWFILDRKNNLLKLSDIKSLIMLTKLAEWQRLCSDASYEPIVRISYKAD